MIQGKLSVIVSTYNTPRSLDIVLRALTSQDGAGDFEVVIADDGSGPETAEVILKHSGDIRLVHSWHPDRGFRPAEARNRAVTKATGEYLVFLDGDCVVRPTWLRRHRSLAEKGWIVSGERVWLSEVATARIMAGQADDFFRRSLGFWLLGQGRAWLDRPWRLIDLGPVLPRRTLQRNAWSGVGGGVMAIHYNDFRKLNGFEAAFTGWGYEDWDIAFRAHRSGMKIKDGRFALAVFHLWHTLTDRDSAPANRDRFEAMTRSERIRAELGVDELEASGPTHLHF